MKLIILFWVLFATPVFAAQYYLYSMDYMAGEDRKQVYAIATTEVRAIESVNHKIIKIRRVDIGIVHRCED